MEYLHFARLSDIAIAPRVRNLLEGAYQCLWHDVERGLNMAADEFEKEQFKSAERAPSTEQQHRALESIREVKKRRAELIAGVRDELQTASLAVLDPRLRPTSTDAHQSKAQLALVDTGELEETLLADELVAKLEVRHSNALLPLAIRYAVIGGGAPIPPEWLPIGPQRVVAAIMRGARVLQMSPRERVAFVRQVERSLLLHYGAVLERVNHYLVTHRVFPNLQLSPMRPRPAAAAAAPSPPNTAERTSNEAPSAPTDAGTAETGTNALRQPSPAVEGASPVSRYASSPSDPTGEVLPARPRVSAAPGAAPSSATHEPASPADLELFTTLRELLAGRRVMQEKRLEQELGPQALAAQRAQPQATTQDVQSILAVMQSQPPAPVMVGGKWVSRRISDIKQDLLAQLRAFNPDQPPRIADEDSDTIDLVGMLFDYLQRDIPAASSAHTVLSKLQVPLLKVALGDKTFFTRRSHPARQFLNTVAEASAFWQDEDDADRTLLDKMQLVVDRVVADFDNDVSVFSGMLDDFTKHIQTLQRKAEVLEKRHVDAAKGREKLDLARDAAARAIDERLRDKQLPELVRSLLSEAWCDVLALTMLRHGEDSQVFLDRLHCADALLACFDADPAIRGQVDFDDLRGALEQGLALIGFHPDDIEKTLLGLAGSVPRAPAPSAPAPASTIGTSATSRAPSDPQSLGAEESAFVSPAPDVAPVGAMDGKAPVDPAEATQIVRSRQRLGEDGGKGHTTILQSLRKSEREQLSPKELAVMERIKQLPFGTWFEFTLNQQGHTVRRKLSWFSPVTSRCLFVNARGAKVEERSMEQLAKDLIRGQAKVVEHQEETLIDRAWKAIKASLQSFRHEPTVAEVAAAGAAQARGLQL